MSNELARAIANGELRLEYQPKVDLATGSLRGVEALVRWQHPSHPIASFRWPSRATRSARSPGG